MGDPIWLSHRVAQRKQESLKNIKDNLFQRLKDELIQVQKGFDVRLLQFPAVGL